MDGQDLVGRLGRVPYTGAISDVLDELGYRRQVLPSSIRPLDPGSSVAGRALTLRGEPSDEGDADTIFEPFLRMLGELQEGDVIVSQPNDEHAAHFGELSCESARARGARGAIIDGGVRDTGYILRQGFPVFARYATPSDILGRWRLAASRVPVRIGDVTVETGDYVVGDGDGVVVIPRAVAAKVTAQVEAVVATEDLVRRDVIAGVLPLEAYRRHGRF